MVVVGYMRLSKEDMDNNISDSIKNQQKIIEQYAKQHNIVIDKYYYDDGVSGYSMDRPSFNQIKRGLNNNTIDMVIVKDLSRLGRHNAQVNLFIENMVECGKTLIAINDNFNSNDEQANGMLGIQTWINEKYVKDTSVKIKKSIRAMQEEGRYISSVPYGYKQNPLKKNDYSIDERAAKYVKLIFNLYLQGNGTKKICRYLTNIGAPTASMLKKHDIEERGGVYKGQYTTRWSENVVKTILENDFYIGTLTLNKSRRRSINGKKIKQKEEDLLVFPNRHEPIIDIETFNATRESYKERTKGHHRGRRIQTRPNLYVGLLKCAECGKKLTSTSNDINTRYVCITYNTYGTDYCTSHCVRENDITDTLILLLKQCLVNMDKILDKLDEYIKEAIKEQSKNSINVDKLIKIVKEYENEVARLTERKVLDSLANPSMEERINKTYDKIIQEKYLMIDSYETQIKETMNNNDYSDSKNNMITARKIVEDIIDSKDTLSKKQVQSIIKEIVVHEDGGLDFHLKGDLDLLVDNKLTIKICRNIKMIEDIYQYFFCENNDRVTPTEGWKHATNNGISIGYINYKKFFQMFVNNEYVKYIGYNKGYKVATTKEQFQNDYSLNTNGEYTTCLPKNNVIISIISNVNEWIRNISVNSKRLF